MANAFQRLCDELRAEAGNDSPALIHNEEGIAYMSFALDGVNITVSHDPRGTNSDHVLTLVEFGTIPSAVELPAWLALMHVNLALRGEGTMSFARDPSRGTAFLRCTHLLDGASGTGLLQSLALTSRLAREWRSGFFLDVDAHSSAATLMQPSELA